MPLIKTKENTNDVNIEFENIIKDLIDSSTVQEMKKYMQHCDTSCFDHCRNVAYYSFILCKKLNLDYSSATRGAMLHDLFLYNWRKSQRSVKLEGLHAFVHPKIALKNSSKFFDLNDIEKDVILKHMWPLTIKFPRYIESFVITFVDKFCAIEETIDYIRKKDSYIYIYRYSTILLAFLVLNI